MERVLNELMPADEKTKEGSAADQSDDRSTHLPLAICWVNLADGGNHGQESSMN